MLFSWDEYSEHNGHFYIEKDVPLFIDYLLPFVLYSKRQVEKIIENLEKSIYGKTDVYPKYKWVANYLFLILNIEDKHEDLMKRIE